MRKFRFWYISIVLISIILTMLGKYLLNYDSVLYNSFDETHTYEQIREMIVQSKKWEWVGYCIIPFIYLVKYSVVALCLSVGIFLNSNRFEFKKMLNVAVKAEIVFLLPIAIKLLWFLFVQTSYNLKDFQYFYPLSALNIFEANTLDPWLIYPLQVLNIFELVYWIVLAYLLTKELPELDMNRSMTVVMASYGTGLVIWVALVMFLTLTYT